MRVVLIVLAALMAGQARAGGPASVTVAGGQTVAVAGTDIQVQLVDVADGRCPVGVDCVWEGLVRVELLVHTGNGDWVRQTLCNLCDDGWHEALVRGWIIGLVRLDPTREDLAALGRPARLEDYRAVLAIEPR